MYGKEDLTRILEAIDEEALLRFGKPASRYRVVIVGGSAFMLNQLTRRPATHDIDVLQADSAIQGILSQYGMVNGRVAAYMDSLPYNFEDRLVELPVKGTAVQFLSPSLEDLAVMKLYAWRPNDEADLTSPETLSTLDWDALDKLVNNPDEAKASALSETRYREMCDIYLRFRKRWHDEADV